MSISHAPAKQWHGFPVAPTTALGKWAVVAAVASGVGWLVVFPVAAFGSTGEWVPLVRHGERAVSVYLGYVPVACILVSSAINSLFFSG